MDYLQYYKNSEEFQALAIALEGFKPCYKWITFNT